MIYTAAFTIRLVRIANVSSLGLPQYFPVPQALVIKSIGSQMRVYNKQAGL